MKRSIVITTLAIGAALASSAVMAQAYGSQPSSAMSQDGAVNSPSAMSGSSSQSTTPAMNPSAFGGSFNAAGSMPMAPSANSAGVNASAMAPQVILLDSNTPGAQLVSSPAIPDTAENRARYGGPESNGGRATKAVGN